VTNPEDPTSPATSGTSPTASGVGDPPTGARIGVYEVLGMLGAGGMGTVVLAFDSRLQRRVAIKRIRAGSQASPLARERLRREAAAAATLNHSAVVQVYDILQEDLGEAIVMEYVEGRTLAQMLARGPLPIAQALQIARQVAEGLAAAHGLGLIHRDLKTQNVMVTPSGQAKILDFGLAKRMNPGALEDSLTEDGALVGTRHVMSPEQAKGVPADTRSDLFSLGVLIYETCTGRSPFRAEGRGETLERVISEVPPSAADLNPRVPAPLAGLVRELLEKDPARRPASAESVAERLREMERRRSASRWPARAGAIGVLALVVVAVAALWRSRPPARPVAVMVQEPMAAPVPGDERSALAAFALREAILRALTTLEGIEVVGSEELPQNPLSLQDTVRAVAADEVVVPVLDCPGTSCRVSLRRQRGGDARILGDSGPFDVSSDPEDALALSEAVAIHLRKTFADHRPRVEGPPVEVKGADYERYLSFRRRMDAGEVLASRDVEELEQLIQSSPGLIEARLLAARTARLLKDRARATRILREADLRDHDDPRLASERFQLELETGTVASAQDALGELEKRAPGDVLLLRARARLLIRQGKLQEAVETLRRLLRERPSWKNLWSIADVEIDLGDARGAREHLRQLLEVSPRNPRGRAKLAELEWFLGDPAQAVRIYQELLKERETQENVFNLGWSLLLAGDYAAAAVANRRALELDPNDVFSRLNLGIAYDGVGDHDGAARVYRDLLNRLALRDPKTTPDVAERLLHAQVLARLGQTVPAVEITMKVLAEGERDSRVLFQAALIYTLCADLNHAVVQATEARQRGLSPRWFSLPGFEPLRDTEAFRRILAAG
jgi:eukaryotic-like serine/threonine-protein kinase